MMLQAVDVLSGGKDMSDRDLAVAMDDFTCRCGTHPRILPAMKQAAQTMKKEGKS
jgi:isoquinoline 1-oxidoreductase alpha subunit